MQLHKPFAAALTAILLCFCLNPGECQDLSKTNLLCIKKAVQGKKIIGLGEEEHYRLTIYEIKTQILKSLITDGTINSIVIEASGTDAEMINQYIHTGLGSRAEQEQIINTRKNYAGTLYDSKIVFDFIEWLRSYNKEHANNKVSFFGMDFTTHESSLEKIANQFPHNTKVRYSLRMLSNNLDTLKHAFLTAPVNLFQDSFYIKTAANTIHTIAVLENQIRHSNKAASVKYDVIQLKQLACYYSDPNCNRDSIMNKNLLTYLRKNKNCKIAVWAAGFHIQNECISSNYCLLGNYLTKEFKSEYYKIGIFEHPPCIPVKNSSVSIVNKNCSIFNKFDMWILADAGKESF